MRGTARKHGVAALVAVFIGWQALAAAAGGVPLEMVNIKGGCYQMGDTFGDGGNDEKPVHEVCVGDFSLGKYEVTQEQWQALMGSNPSQFTGDKRPVEQVSWDDAQQFIARLNQATGKHYRLPTEAEWEYAARSGGKKEKYAGMSDDGRIGDFAWHEKNSSGKTHVVGKLQPNGLGLYDMSGNVWEWCSDWYGDVYYEESPRDNPQGPKTGADRVDRGGSWNIVPWRVRASDRSGDVPGYRSYYLGFRLASPPGQ